MKNKDLLTQNGVDLEKSLELFGDMEMYNESLGDFMAEVDNKLYKIGHFKEMADMSNYAILVHSLKSDAKYFGFTKLAELAYAHELQSKENNTIFVNENYAALLEEANRIIAIVKEYMGSSAASSAAVNPASQSASQTNAQASVTPAPVTSPPVAPLPVKPTYETRSLLVADDSDIIKNFVRKIFANQYNVLTANDGAEAINFINNNETYNIMALLLDLNMPNVDGFKVLNYMKDNDLFKNIPVAVITGNDSRDIDLNAFEFPIVDILKKPFSEESVKNIVERTIYSKNNS